MHGVAQGAQLLAVRHIIAHHAAPVLCVTHHDKDLVQLTRAASFFLPELPVISFPAWDCLPYDRAAPNRSILAARSAALTEILYHVQKKQPFVVLTTANAFVQKLPPAQLFSKGSLRMAVGEDISHDILTHFLTDYGYRRAAKVMEAGEYALRGNIIDIFPAGSTTPYRLDLFGETIETITPFEVMSQRSHGAAQSHLPLCPTSELQLNSETIAHFRKKYLTHFGTPHPADSLYHHITEGQYAIGAEHYLPFFYESMTSLPDLIPTAKIILDAGVHTTLKERIEMIEDYYQARLTHANQHKKSAPDSPYHPVPPHLHYITLPEMEQRFAMREAMQLSPFDAPNTQAATLHTRPARNIAAAIKTTGDSPFAYLSQEMLRTPQQAIVIAGNTHGSMERLTHILQEAGLHPTITHDWREIQRAKEGLFLIELELTRGFTLQQNASSPITFYSEEDMLGRRIIQVRKRRHDAQTFMNEAASFEIGEVLVHRDHGIGRFAGLVTVEVGAARHDCLQLLYQGNDKLFLPVENMELISRHGGELSDHELDKLGAGNWQARKAAYREKLRLTAEELLSIAAARELSTAQSLQPHPDAYADFANQFPYDLTEDQESAIEDVLQDMAGSKPMDRLICGDVGFGKTEVALRAAFAAAADTLRPQQVAFIAPTTLLARQHYHHVKERFANTGLNVAQLSRIVPAKQAKQIREDLTTGKIDIVVGTHALLAESITFSRLGLLIIDEEQRFGVKQKEKLKKLKSNIHVLTMSATPIPRTLQMSLSGVRDLSLITTPPVDRLAIRSFVQPFDPIVLREAMMREMHRGGIVFYVTPRIADLDQLRVNIMEMIPHARLCIAHGQLPPSELDSLMNDVYDGKYDILLSTSIIESGIDIPSANTIIINRADKFGLAQLYQLRGRVGRGKVRAYAYFTMPHHNALTPQAMRRLEVMQSLDTLGAGFTLASHDMDIRGFGNLVGDEQSGHVKEVGIELYQQMLADAVKEARAKALLHKEDMLPDTGEDWSPQLSLGLPIFIPEEYVEDLSLRLSLYRRASLLQSEADIESFAAELSDRFGAIPPTCEYLFTVLAMKLHCKQLGIARIDTGPKGAVIAFREGAIARPEALLGFIHRHKNTMKLRADQTLFYGIEWRDDAHKLECIKQLLGQLASFL
jgi:transcription-repair coupling factor (superfamily II helicase)